GSGKGGGRAGRLGWERARTRKEGGDAGAGVGGPHAAPASSGGRPSAWGGATPITVAPEQPSRRAAGEAFPDPVLRQVAADEDDAAFALLALLPRPLMIAVEDHVHALEYEARVVVLERQDAFAAQNAGSFGWHELLHPGEELVRVERPLGLERNRLYVLVVIVLQAAAIMVMLVIVIVIVVVIVVMVTAVAEKFRLDVQDAVEIEGIASQHLRQRDLAALGPVQLGIG